MLEFIRNSREQKEHCRVFLVSKSLYLYSRIQNLCFMTTIINNSFCTVRNTKDINDLLRWYYSDRYLRKKLFIKVVYCNFTYCNFITINFSSRVAFLFQTKKCLPTTFRWLLLFIAFIRVAFTKKVCFIETASFAYPYTMT